ncbi:MAG: hypothetical protein IJ143_07905 [Neisseriaceae bacterium]|nr:hypothetical protein [Neisseriaceae bacterium]
MNLKQIQKDNRWCGEDNINEYNKTHQRIIILKLFDDNVSGSLKGKHNDRHQQTTIFTDNHRKHFNGLF